MSVDIKARCWDILRANQDGVEGMKEALEVVTRAVEEAQGKIAPPLNEPSIAKLAADRVQERALALEGRAISAEQSNPDDYATVQWLRLAADQLRRVERELRGEGNA